MSRTTPQDLSGDEQLAQRVHEQLGRGAVAQRADSVNGGSVAGAGLDHEAAVTGRATCSKRGVVSGAPFAAALRAGGLGGRVAAVAVRRRHASDITVCGEGCQGPSSSAAAAPARAPRRRWA